MGRRSSYRIDKSWEEERTTAIVESGFFSYPFVAAEDKQTQKKGIDGFLLTPKGKLSLELKAVRYQSSVGAITIETHSNLERSGNPNCLWKVLRRKSAPAFDAAYGVLGFMGASS